MYCRLLILCFVDQLSTGKSKWAVALKILIGLGCLEQRQTVYISNCLLPVSHEQLTCKLGTVGCSFGDFKLIAGVKEAS